MTQQTQVETVTFALGIEDQREYTVGPIPHARSEKWRGILLSDLKPIFEELGAASDIEFATPADLIKVVPLIQTVLGDTLDIVFRLVVSYHPALSKDKRWIKNHASDKQLIHALTQILKVADPFGLDSLFRNGNGLLDGMMSLNSQEQSGESANENSTN